MDLFISNKGDKKEEEERYGESCQNKNAWIDILEFEKKKLHIIKLPYQIKLSALHAVENFKNTMKNFKYQITSKIKTTKKQKYNKIPRSFKETSDKKIFIKEYMFPEPENDGTLAIRSMEHKYFPGFIKTLTEVLRFTRDCLSEGRNEIIYLDKKKKSFVKHDSEYYKPGNISRFEINKIDLNRRIKYTDVLKDGILNCFDGNASAIADECITNSIFIKVKITGGKNCDYVIDMDVETSLIFSKNLKNIEETTNTFKNNIKDTIYVRIGSFTILIENNSDQRFTVKELSGLELNRNCFEMKILNRLPSWQCYLALKHVDPKHYSTTLIKRFLNYYICKLLRDLNSVETFVSILQNPSPFNAEEKEGNDTKFIDIYKITNEIKAENRQVYTQIPRSFKESPNHKEYCEGYIFSQPESDGTLASRCFEFKYFVDCVNNSTKNVLIKFLIEVLKFSCGCLNKRRNGTICFGIADNCIKKSDSENYKHGEIVGFPLDDIGLNSIKMYTDALREGILLCFDDKSAAVAAKCISDPKFVKVKIAGENKCRYVMEVDVESSFMFCTNLYFTVNLHKLKNPSFIDNTNFEKLANKFLNTDKYFLFLRKGSSTKHIENKNKEQFIEKELLDLVVSRICFEIRGPNFTVSDQIYQALQKIERCYSSDPQNCALKFIKDVLDYIGKSFKDHNGKATLVFAQDIPCSIDKKQTFFNAKVENREIDAKYQITRTKKAKYKQINTQNPRSFKESPDTKIYCKGYILTELKSDETIATRLMEFRYFVDCLKNPEKNFLDIFVKEVLKFFDSCLNSRRFGTIYFGIADNSFEKPDSEYKNGEIIGFDIDEIDLNSRFKYTDALRNALSKSFYGHTSDIAEECLSNPLFVKVKIPGENKFCYVIEVDVEPSFIFCKGLYFKIDSDIFMKQKNKSNRKKKYQLFVHEGFSIKNIENDSTSQFIKEELPNLVENRYCFEIKGIGRILTEKKLKSKDS